MGVLGTLGSLAGGVIGGVVGGPTGALAGYSAVNGLVTGQQQQKKADQLNQQALDAATQQYAAKGPYRALADQQLGHAEQAYDMGDLGRNSSNPFAHANVSNAVRTGTANDTFTAPVAPDPAAQQQTQQLGLYTAIANNAQLPAAIRKQAQQKLAAYQAVPPAPTTSYGWTGQ